MKKLIAQYEDGSTSVYNSIIEASIDLILPVDEIVHAIYNNVRAHGIKLSWMKEDKRGYHSNVNARPVYQIDKSGKIVSEFSSVYQASIITGICNIHRSVRNSKLTAGGFYWRHKY